MEIFKDVPNYEGLYQVSNLGRVKSLARKGRLKDRILKPKKDGSGYLMVNLRKDNKSKTRTVHQLVAMAFLGHTPCGYKLIVNHENFIRHDNRLENLEIISSRENTNQKHLKSSSEYTGVCWNKKANKWTAQIKINGKIKHLGSFACELKAAYTYQTELKRIT
tara:strand:+ start:106 stop:594 length:489 start_codon:yes stop_codon:yes gene_type:complete